VRNQVLIIGERDVLECERPAPREHKVLDERQGNVPEVRADKIRCLRNYIIDVVVDVAAKEIRKCVNVDLDRMIGGGGGKLGGQATLRGYG
jgi:hypothetical protein